MIVVLGRPAVHRPEPDGALAPAGLACEIATAIAAAGAAVELAGAVGDDGEGDELVVALGRAGVGHAALLRDPAARTPSPGAVAAASEAGSRPLPRLEAADVELALRYLPECRALVVVEAIDPAALAAALRAADYHGAAAIVIAPAGHVEPGTLDDSVTLLELPGGDQAAAGEEPGPSFARMVAGYARRLADGESPGRAFAAALEEDAWEPVAD